MLTNYFYWQINCSPFSLCGHDLWITPGPQNQLLLFHQGSRTYVVLVLRTLDFRVGEREVPPQGRMLSGEFLAPCRHWIFNLESGENVTICHPEQAAAKITSCDFIFSAKLGTRVMWLSLSSITSVHGPVTHLRIKQSRVSLLNWSWTKIIDKLPYVPKTAVKHYARLDILYFLLNLASPHPSYYAGWKTHMNL